MDGATPQILTQSFERKMGFPKKSMLAKQLFSRMLHKKDLNEMLFRIKDLGDETPFIRRFLDELDIFYKLDEGDWERIPQKGSFVVVANHPFGAIEGAVLLEILMSVRSDVKVITNSVLSLVPELRDVCIFVNSFDDKGAGQSNLKPIRETLKWLENGGMIVTFPAGAVSHFNLKERQIVDPPWQPTIGRLIRSSKASVLPIHFDGNNGPLFQTVGFFHPFFRTMMLKREIFNKRGKTIKINVGNPISARKLEKSETDEDVINYLRKRTYLLGSREVQGNTSNHTEIKDLTEQEKIIDPVPSHLLSSDISNLKDSALLCSFKNYSIYCTTSGRIPNILEEIGRLREISFRAVEEGSGKSRDLDKYDEYYEHLFLWNNEKEEVVGAYRLGRGDVILSKYGLNGLYTNELFEFDLVLIEQLGTFLELGRSFIRLEYQRQPSSLMLLWKGIGAFVSRNPDYCQLMGPVSISDSYKTASQHLMIEFLKTNELLLQESRLVRPKVAYESDQSQFKDIRIDQLINRDIEEISSIVSDLEPDGKGVPILLKQYLKLGGKVLSFNVDRNFNDAIDALTVVDLRRTPQNILRFYMGKEPAQAFLSSNGVGTAERKEEFVVSRRQGADTQKAHRYQKSA